MESRVLGFGMVLTHKCIPMIRHKECWHSAPDCRTAWALVLLQSRGEFRSERNVSSLFGMIARHNRNMCEYTFSYKENPLLGASAPDFLQFLDSAVQRTHILRIHLCCMGCRYQSRACRVV